MKRISLSLIVLTFWLGCNQSSVKKDQPRLILSQIFGQVQVERAGDSPTARVGLELQMQDAIVTGPGSSAALAFPGLGVVRVGANARVEARSIVEAASSAKVELRLTRGALVSYVNKRDAESEFSVSTPTVIASVRGTAFLVSVDNTSVVTVAVSEGAVAVVTPGSSEEVIVEKNAQIVIENAKRLERAMIRPLSDQALKAIRTLSVFQKSSVLEYNTLLDDISRSTPELRVLENNISPAELLKEREEADVQSGGADAVEKADRADDSKILKRDTENDPLKIKPASEYSK